MRWNCPHCGVNLAIADEKMSASWSFSRCYQCGGYALVRKSEVNIIKVDRAPAGEKVILPEASENPIHMMSEVATRNLARYSNSNAATSSMNASAGNEKPVVKPATRRNTSPGMTNPLLQQASQTAAASSMPSMDDAFTAGPPPGMDAGAYQTAVPNQPFAPVSQKHSQQPLSGPHAPAGATADRSAPPLAYMNGVNNVGLFPEPLPDVPASESRIRLLPMAIGITAAFALGSGLYLLMQSGEIIEKSRPTLSDRRPAEMPAETATATAVSFNEEAPPARERKAQQAVAAVAPAPSAAPASAGASAAHAKNTTLIAKNYSDQVRSQAMAPERQPQASHGVTQPIPTAPNPVQLSADNPPLIVQPKIKNTHLRAGPGMVYPVVGNADEKARYVVTDWNDRWFKVLPQVPTGNQQTEEVAGWIRTDTVQVVSDASSTN